MNAAPAPPPPAIASRPAAVTSRRAIGPHSNGLSMTPAEFDAVEYEDCDPGYRYELIRGEVVARPMPGPPHGALVQELFRRISDYREAPPRGGGTDGTLCERYIGAAAGRRIADLLIWCGLGRAPRPADVPTIAVEVVSERTRDRDRDYIEKRAEYRDAGIAEYWIVDRFERKVTVAEATGAEREVGEFEPLTSPRLPGFEVTPHDLFREAERWEA